MAVEPHSAPEGVWNSCYQDYLSLNQQLGQIAPAERDAIEQRMAGFQDVLLGLPAPDFAAVLTKLNWLWESKLHGLDASSQEKILLLDDIARLSLAQG